MFTLTLWIEIFYYNSFDTYKYNLFYILTMFTNNYTNFFLNKYKLQKNFVEKTTIHSLNHCQRSNINNIHK